MKTVNYLVLIVILLGLNSCSKDNANRKSITFSFKNLSKSLGNAQGFLATEPSTVGDFDCFAVITAYPEQPKDSSCRQDGTTDVLIYPNQVDGMAQFSSGATLTASIITGQARKFGVFAWASDSGNCYSLTADYDSFKSDLSKPYFIGSTVSDIDAGTDKVQIKINSGIDLSSVIVGECTGPVFNNGEDFDPSIIGGLKVWLDASEGSTVFETTCDGTLSAFANDNVGCWKSKVGSYAFIQSATSQRPDYVDNSFGGRPSIRFQGGEDFLKDAGTTPPAKGSMYVVFATDVAVQAGVIIGSHTTGEQISMEIYNSSGFKLRGGVDVASTAVSVGPVAASSSYVGSMTYDSTAANVAIGLNATYDTNSSSAFTPNGDPFAIGRNDYTATDYFRGRIAEVLLYDKVLSSANNVKVRDYLTQKWGVTQ